MSSRRIAVYYPSVRTAMPVPGVGYPRLTAPFATSPWSKPQGFVRLACLIHAANVHSEPGSNPSKMVRHGFAGPKADFPRIGPHPERLRKEIQSQSARSRHDPKAVPLPHSLPVRAAHPAALAASGPRRPGVPGRRLARRPPSRVPHMHAKRAGLLPLASSFTCFSFSG